MPRIITRRPTWEKPDSGARWQHLQLQRRHAEAAAAPTPKQIRRAHAAQIDLHRPAQLDRYELHGWTVTFSESPFIAKEIAAHAWRRGQELSGSFDSIEEARAWIATEVAA